MLITGLWNVYQYDDQTCWKYLKIRENQADFEYFELILRLQKGSKLNLGTHMGPSEASKPVYPSHVLETGGGRISAFSEESDGATRFLIGPRSFSVKNGLFRGYLKVSVIVRSM